MRLGRPRPVQRGVDRFRSDPGSIRNATLVIISVTVVAVFVGSLVMWVLDKRDFNTYGNALWFVLQTVTTVGYGDVTPTSAEGRTVAAVVMIVAIAFLAIITALITSTFIDAAQRRRRADDLDAAKDQIERVDARFDEIAERLTAIEAALGIRSAAATADQASDAPIGGAAQTPAVDPAGTHPGP